MEDQEKIFTIDTFGALIDDLLEKGDIHFKIRMPSGTMDPEITENIGAGPVMQFYVLIRALPHIIEELIKTENLDENKIPDLLDSLFGIMKHDILEDLGFKEAKEDA